MSAVDRFWIKVNMTATCWLWTAYRDPHGYGKFRYEGGSRLAHRVSYEWAHGPIPEGMMIDHQCHVPACVNPAHLRLVNSKQNQENRLVRRSDGGLRGASYYKERGTWLARAKHNRKVYFAGYHATAEEAAEAARQLRLSLYTHNDPDRKAA